MSSLKMTFSLASLVLIFAFAFAAMPVMAADGGPEVTGLKLKDDSTRANFGFDLTFVWRLQVLIRRVLISGTWTKIVELWFRR